MTQPAKKNATKKKPADKASGHKAAAKKPAAKRKKPATKPKKNPGKTKNNAEAALARQREHDALQLRIGGGSLRQIGEALGISHETARQALDRAMQRLIEDTQDKAEDLQTIQGARLEALFLGIWPKALAGVPDQVDRALKVMERQARLFGLDGPVKIHDVTPAAQARERLAALLGIPLPNDANDNTGT